MLNVAYHYMDLVPKGRDEDGQGQFWVRRRDEYPGAIALMEAARIDLSSCCSDTSPPTGSPRH
jgi:hypothetical protein